MNLFKKTANVYWTSIYFPATSSEPDSALRDLLAVQERLSNEDPIGSAFIKCPAIKNHLRNTFRVKSPTKIDIKWDGDKLFNTFTHDQKFFDEYIKIRDNRGALVTYRFYYLFFTEEPSMLVEQRQAQYSFNDFSKNVSLIEGHFDIGKWFRPFDIAFFLKEANRVVTLNRNDTMYYLKFHTEKNIKFIKFNLTSEITKIYDNLTEGIKLINKEKKGIRNLNLLYDMFQHSRYKKHLLKLIKQNTLN